MSARTTVKLLAGVIITVIIVYYSISSLQGLNVGMLLHSNINWGLTAVSVFIFMYSNYIRGLAYTRGIDRSMDAMTALQIVGIGHAMNMVLPLHLGEGLRAIFFPGSYSAIRRTKLLIIPAFADFIAIMVLSLIAVPFAGFKDEHLLDALWILSLVCIAALLMSVLLIFVLPRLRGYLSDYLNFGLVQMMFYVMLSWILLLVSAWIGVMALDFPLVPSIRMSLAVFAATNIINFIPASPGAIGLFEYAAVIGLGGLDINPSTALAVGLLQHLIQYAALLPLGLFLYIKALQGQHGKTLKNMWKINRQKGDKKLHGDEKQ